ESPGASLKVSPMKFPASTGEGACARRLVTKKLQAASMSPRCSRRKLTDRIQEQLVNAARISNGCRSIPFLGVSFASWYCFFLRYPKPAPDHAKLPRTLLILWAVFAILPVERCR